MMRAFLDKILNPHELLQMSSNHPLNIVCILTLALTVKILPPKIFGYELHNWQDCTKNNMWIAKNTEQHDVMHNNFPKVVVKTEKHPNCLTLSMLTPTLRKFLVPIRCFLSSRIKSRHHNFHNWRDKFYALQLGLAFFWPIQSNASHQCPVAVLFPVQV